MAVGRGGKVKAREGGKGKEKKEEKRKNSHTVNASTVGITCEVLLPEASRG